MKEPIILWEGACAYAVRDRNGYRIIVHSSNYVRHVEVGRLPPGEGGRAERVTRRLNAYPRQAYGLLR